MPTLIEKASTLAAVAQSIIDENYYDDVTAEQQADLETAVLAVRSASRLLKLVCELDHVHKTTPKVSRARAAKERLRPLCDGSPSSRKLRVVR